MFPLNDYIDVLASHGPFADGGTDESRLRIAQEWEEYEFSPQRVNQWLAVGVFCPSTADELRDCRIPPHHLERYAPFFKDELERVGAGSIGYALANGDLGVERLLSCNS